MSSAREWTDKELAKMERDIAKIYKQAEKEMREKWEAYMLKGNSRISALEKDYRDALKVGDEEIIANIEEQLKKAKENFTFKNDYYRDMVNSVTLDMAQVNNKAREYVNGKIPEIYAKNYEEANEIVKDMQLSFTLPNENAIKNRILEGKVKTPYMRTTNFIKIPKDQRWNTKFINSQVLQGIIQGEDMRKIANRIFPEIQEKTGGLPERNRAAAIRNARTLVTGAENQGKHDSYEDLSERGIVLKQVWIATGDDRTRESHLEMDGQEVDVGEPFIAINRDGKQCELMYPADPNGDAEQVYNCRCALISRVVGFRNADGTIRMVSEANEGQDLHDKQIEEQRKYREWVKEQKEKEEKDSPVKHEPMEIINLKTTMYDDDYDKFMEIVSNADSVNVWEKYGNTVSNVRYSSTGGYYQSNSDTLVFSYDHEKYEGINKYSILAHEFNHAFDHKIGANSSLSFKEVDKINEECKFGTGIFKMLEARPSTSDEFLNALREDMENLKSKGVVELYKEFRETTELRNATSGIQDALDGFFSTTKTLAGWGHGDSYYNRGYNKRIKNLGQEKNLKKAFNDLGFDASNQTKVKRIYRQYEAANEAWANVGSAVTCGGAELDAIETYMPKTLEAYKQIIGGLK